MTPVKATRFGLKKTDVKSCLSIEISLLSFFQAGAPSGLPPIQVTAKVLFGSVAAISALNAERKKKA